MRGRKVAVFDYSVAQEDSHLILPDFRKKGVVPRADEAKYSGPVTNFEGAVIPPYTGEVWIDASTGAIRRHSTRLAQLPADWPMRSSFDETNFDEVALGDTKYLLRVSDVSPISFKHDIDRFEYVFRDFRRFEADSSVVFYDADSKVVYEK